MKNMKQSAAFLFFISISILSFAQDTIKNSSPENLRNAGPIIPDKVTEIAIPLLAAFLFFNIILNIYKNRADHQLKLRMIEKGISEESLAKIFKESNLMAKLQPIKWFLFSFATALSFIFIHSLRNSLRGDSGYLAMGIILLFISAAAFIYYRIISKSN